jgi:hypothetical protein
MKTFWNWPKPPFLSSHSSQNSTYIIILNEKINCSTTFDMLPSCSLEKNTTFFICIRPSDTNLTLIAKWRVEEMTWLRCALQSKDAYNSYHYECIEKQTCHTLTKLFIVGCNHKDLASPIQQGKWKSFIGLFKCLFQIR